MSDVTRLVRPLLYLKYVVLLIAFSREERIHVLRARLDEVMADFEMAPFIDTGRVFNTITHVSFKDYRVTPGIEFRGIVPWANTGACLLFVHESVVR